MRVVAESADAARAAVPRLEDALRCASLPDAGARLLLVRRLALGRIARQASSQAIARVIEARFADSAVVWTDGAGPDSPGAEHVAFRSAWHARVALTRRLLLGRACSAWYWPLAAPEFRIGASADYNVRAIARAVALSEEAPVALPAWAAHVVQGGNVRTLAALVPSAFGNALLKEAGLAMPVDIVKGAALAVLPPQQTPLWLERLLIVGGWREEPLEAQGARLRVASRAATEAPTPRADVPSPGLRSSRERSVEALLPPTRPGRIAHAQDAVLMPPFEAARTTTNDAAAQAAGLESRAGDLRAEFDAAPTLCGGLLFLLPVLARLGLPRWAEPRSAAWTCAVLAAALQRLRVPRDDPMWLLAGLDVPLPRHEACAPASWQNLLLSPRGAPSAPLPVALMNAATAPEQASLWLTAARRWLRRGARIGLSNLVLRPGWLGITPTHVDVHFRLDAVDLRVRRIGFDIDPGWLPWFGRVVTYHYRDARELP